MALVLPGTPSGALIDERGEERGGTRGGEPSVTPAVELHLLIEDPETVAELRGHHDHAERTAFACAALRVGVMAVRHARGNVDVTSVRQESERLLHDVRSALTVHATQTLERLSAVLSTYFDPSRGDVVQRLDRLVRKDGELELLLARHLEGEASTLARTIVGQVGENSPLMKALAPDSREGVVAAMREVVTSVVASQNRSIVQQFSLDDHDSALSRLVAEVSETSVGETRRPPMRDGAPRRGWILEA